MTDYSFLFLLLGVVILLVVQILVLGMLREIRLVVDAALRRVQEQNQVVEIAHFEHERAVQSRRFKYRSQTDLAMDMSILGVKLKCTVRDISETGVMFQCDDTDRAKVGESYPVSIHLDGTHIVQANVRIVRWIADAKAFGGCFEELPLESKRMIREFVTKRAKKELEADLTTANS